ncbi:MAG: hypothetical protein JRN62_03070 [Nitrososphaerota archaeon]|jgi:predicted hydrocarbon binding protein|nr:hypothetical protein [Nitrososphaerota archaeon]MDG6948975.1 hypothetical protein [Nitrososphaerota archaeon]
MLGRYQRNTKHVQVLVVIDDRIVSAADIHAAVLKTGVSIEQANMYRVKRNTVVFNAFAVVDGAGATPERLEGALRGIKGVTDVRVAAGKDSVLVDTLTFPVVWGGERVVLMRQKAIMGVFSGIRSMLGREGDTLLYNSGYAYGSDFIRFLTDVVGAEKLVSTLGYALELFSAAGWGVTELAPDRASITVADCFECGERKASKGICSFMRGMLTGFMEPTTRRQFHMKEVECRAKGDDKCVFLLDSGRGTTG